MSLHRTKSFIEEEALLTRPSSPFQPGSSNAKPTSAREYDIEHPDDVRLERQGLLQPTMKGYRDTDEEDESGEMTNVPLGRRVGGARRKRRRIYTLAGVLALLLVGGFFARPLLSDKPPGSKDEDDIKDPHALLSNGTHEYRKTVLLVSIDGLRADYLDRGLTPHLLHISKRGLRAEWMKPAFPTLTFPNHWALMTGLYPESHGIVGNNFYDPELEAEFVYTDPKRSHDGKWWGGEPMWETAAKGGLKTAVMMWPGPPRTARGTAPTYFVEFNNDVKMFEKVTQITNWLELPLDDRPRLITVYEPSLDEAGHLTGPSSSLVRTVLQQVDVFAKDIHQVLLDRNLTHIVDVIYVSDHGMTDTSGQRVVYLDEIIGEDGVNDVIYEDGWPNFGLRFAPSANISHYFHLLQEYTVSRHPDSPFEVYTHETMPKRYHFSNNERIAPIYLCPRLGWIISNHHEVKEIWGGVDGRPKGTHGYDNEEPEMRAMFVADGPFAKKSRAKLVTQDSFQEIAQSYLRQLWGLPATTSATAADRIIPGFPNLELYGLVTKILGVEPAPNNGTKGFWDQYF